MMPLQAVDLMLVEQALLTGRVTDAITGEGLKTRPSIGLEWRIGGAGPYKAVAATPRIRLGAYFAFVGAPESFFPTLAPGEELQGRLIIAAEGYQEGVREFVLTAAAVTATERTELHGGRSIVSKTLNPPVHQEDIALSPNPVSLAGRVVEDNDLTHPVSGATVTIIAPAGAGSAVTDAVGYYRIADLPVVRKMTVEIALAGSSFTEELLLDYRQRINEKTFSFTA